MDTKTSFGFNHPSILNEITQSCEKLITDTQSDLEIFRNEQQLLQQQILDIVAENSNFNSKLDNLKNAATVATGDTKDDATRERLTNEALKNIKTQNEHLQRENNDLRLLNSNLKKTIDNLDKEIQYYRNQLFSSSSACEIKQKYTTTIKLLEGTIVTQKSELKKQADVIKSVFEDKEHLRNRVAKLEKSIEEKEKALAELSQKDENINNLQEQLMESANHNKELLNSLKLSKQAVEERVKREQGALQKVQEALSIAEAAVADKEEALRREKIVKEECENIASTIGQVMDEAACKVEKDMETMRKKFISKEKILIGENAKIMDELQSQKKLNEILDKRCNRFNQKYRNALKENEQLLNQLESAAKSLVQFQGDMEQKLSQQQNFDKNTDDQEQEIKHYVETNKQLKERYHKTLCDMMNTFEQGIYRLQNEVDALKAENQVLRSQRSCEDAE